MGEILTKLCGDQSDSDIDIESTHHFNELYTFGKEIGSGAFSIVRTCKRKTSGKQYAVKCIEKSALNRQDEEALHDEVSILRSLRHPNILRFVHFFDESTHFYLITELIHGGELFNRIVSKTTYTEAAARDLVKILLETIGYLHSKTIIHRDLKPENLLLKNHENDTDIKLADFGFAKVLKVPDSLRTVCGTPDYVAPEVISRKPYGLKADIWSIGVITYILLGGYPPFYDKNQTALFIKIKKGSFHYDSPYWDHISPDAKDLINRMLVVSPSNRSSASDLLAHPWMEMSDSELRARDLGMNLKEFRRYNARRKFKIVAKAIIATRRFSKKSF